MAAKSDYSNRLIQALLIPVPPGASPHEPSLYRMILNTPTKDDHCSTIVWIEPEDQFLWWRASVSLVRDAQNIALARLSRATFRELGLLAESLLRDNRGNMVGVGEPRPFIGAMSIGLKRRLSDEEMDFLGPEWHKGLIAEHMRKVTRQIRRQAT
jgi:hypothetical protein